jgi:predicted cytidylate kinase
VIITISGRPGSGKSVVASRVAGELGFRHVSAGDFMREMAAERGITILELSRTAESREDIDREIDARTVRMAEESDDFVIDARLGWHFIPKSFKVFLDVEPSVAAQRVYRAGRGSERENVTLADTEWAIQQRTESERKRYLEYYGLDYTDHDHFDLVIDTSDVTIDEVVAEILGAIAAAGSGMQDPMR